MSIPLRPITITLRGQVALPWWAKLKVTPQKK